MKGIFLIALLLLLSVLPTYAQAEKDSIKHTIVQFFEGLSKVDPEHIKAYSSSDFYLLEDGEIWNMDTLIKAVTGGVNPGMQRINSFQFEKIEQTGSTAWVSYFNTAVFKLKDRQVTVKWLESAVLLKEKKKWKIWMLHSTKLKS